jgi:hypothetical protein
MTRSLILGCPVDVYNDDLTKYLVETSNIIAVPASKYILRLATISCDPNGDGYLEEFLINKSIAITRSKELLEQCLVCPTLTWDKCIYEGSDLFVTADIGLVKNIMDVLANEIISLFGVGKISRYDIKIGYGNISQEDINKIDQNIKKMKGIKLSNARLMVINSTKTVTVI